MSLAALINERKNVQDRKGMPLKILSSFFILAPQSMLTFKKKILDKFKETQTFIAESLNDYSKYQIFRYFVNKDTHQVKSIWQISPVR